MRAKDTKLDVSAAQKNNVLTLVQHGCILVFIYIYVSIFLDASEGAKNLKCFWSHSWGLEGAVERVKVLETALPPSQSGYCRICR